MHKLTINRKLYAVPSSWDDISHEQMLGIAPYILGSDETVASRKVAMLCFLVPILHRLWIHTSYTSRLIKLFPFFKACFPVLTAGQKWDILGLVDWLFLDISGRSIVRHFSHEGVTYYLPEDNLVKESIIAFAFADEYFNRFIATGDALFIDSLISCIARQERQGEYLKDPNWEGDPREQFSTERAKERARKFRTLPGGIKNSILLYFMGSKKFIHQHYEVLFRTANEQSAGDNTLSKRIAGFGQKKIPRPDFGWLAVIYDLAEAGTFGSFNEVKHMFLHTCCYYLAKKRYDYEENTK